MPRFVASSSSGHDSSSDAATIARPGRQEPGPVSFGSAATTAVPGDQEQGLVSFGSAATTALCGDQEHGLVSFAGAATLDCPGDRKDGPVPQLPAEYEELLDRTRDKGLKELCFFYLSSHVYVCNPDRRCSRAKLAASRRSYQLADPADLFEFVRPQIEGAALQQLKADYQALEMLYKRTLAENDLTWVLQCGKEKDPPQRIMLETLGRMLQQTLMRVLDKGSADCLMPILVEQVRELSYKHCILGLYPLLDDSCRAEFQLWYHKFSCRPFLQDEQSSSSRGPAVWSDIFLMLCGPPARTMSNWCYFRNAVKGGRHRAAGETCNCHCHFNFCLSKSCSILCTAWGREMCRRCLRHQSNMFWQYIMYIYIYIRINIYIYMI